MATGNKDTLTLQQATEQTVIAKSDIRDRRASTMSMMPEGLLQTLNPEQVRNLIAYLRHPRQAPLPEP